MKIEFTPEQFETLLKSIAISSWMINAFNEGSEETTAYSELEQYILSFAKDFGKQEFVDYDAADNVYYPTRKFEDQTDIFDIISEYDNELFWDELIHRMARRDFAIEYGEDGISAMAIEERIEKEAPFITKYEEIFANQGLDNIEIK
ncbi:hypothetical protein LEP1GSC058_1766 [Leptospira fainei serovar Hurstbridge str. BUT 6]|uniref:Uncharacterized protein n=1 Tax=Leptospira fainei serovar Hurstbridge str. BUT 6 TaxID=1193011 RepID=S3UW61_9LEPT|nr:hypothetical protein [Leptospira fainei]EPG74636.1 hypothetical protein LEP1GSC058_1766 [Leptospira fainei serovar Hurstbridge str. BUT 6]